MIQAIRSNLAGARLGGGKGCSNAGLALDCCLAAQDDEKARAELLASVSDVTAPAVYHLAYKRWQRALESSGAVSVPCAVQDRLIVGLGAESVLEAGMTLSRVYGVPVIPGSALKGLARHYYERFVEQSGDDHAVVLFGNQESSGYITWFDAWYVPGSAREDKPLRRDVMTVHHRGYYSTKGGDAPTDFEDPTPIGFLSAVGSYLIAVKGPNKEWSEFALELLERALAELGVGGKTSSGYGRLIADEPASAANGGVPAASGLSVEILALTPGKVRPEIGSFYPRWQALEDPEEKRAAAEAIKAKLEQCGALKDKKWLEKPLVVDVLRYLSGAEGGSS